MTEIPEHLLKRSRERRAAIGKGDDSSEDAAPSDAPATPVAAGAAAPAAPPPTGPATRAAKPEPAPPPPPKPDPPYVAAAKRRRKIPFWAMATLSLMPIWGFMYVRALTAEPAVAEGPVGVGAEIYSNCASCHGASGGGGVGYAFSGGEVLATFPAIEDQIRYVYFGTEGYNAAGVEIYGNPDREGGPHVTGARGPMPAFSGQLTEAEIVAVVCHERYTLGGADPTSDAWATEYEEWCSEEAPVYAAVEEGVFSFTAETPTTIGELELAPISLPIPGSPAGG